MRSSFACAVALALCAAFSGWAGIARADNDKGPEQVTMQAALDAEKVAKPAYLPHQAHQWLECDGCHHGKGPDGKMTKYVAGQKIEKCETCHNSKAGMPERMATLKRASHLLCLECHLQQDKELARCGVCHAKK